MGAHPLTDLTLLEAAAGLRRGDFSSTELVRACLDQIERLEPALHVFLSLAPEQALEQARLADQQLVRSRAGSLDLPLLTGIPIVVKDVLAVEGFPCTCGSKILEGFRPPYTATAVQRLLNAGVIVLGKTNTDEFAMGSSTENSAFGVTHNPWKLDRVPGGSSGGTAAALAARMVPGGLGTDTGGSVRQPAAFCGVVGLKPSYGRVSRFGLVAYGSSLDCVGAFGRNVADVAALFSLMAGHDPLDSTSLELPTPALPPQVSPNLEGIRVGVPQEFFIEGMQPEVEQKVRQAIDVLQQLGAEVLPVSLPYTSFALPVYYLIAPAEASANLARYDGIRFGPRSPAETMWEVFFQTRGEHFGAEVKRRIMLGSYALSAGYYDQYYGQAQKVRTLIKQDYEQVFTQVDLVAAPVAPTTAFKIGGHGDDPLAMYLEDIFTLPANLAGIPGLAFPVGMDGQGLPVGMQLMAPHFQEEILFKVAQAYQSVTEWHLLSPSVLA